MLLDRDPIAVAKRAPAPPRVSEKEAPMRSSAQRDKFRTQLGVAIDSVEFAKKALDRQALELTLGKTDQDLRFARRGGRSGGG